MARTHPPTLLTRVRRALREECQMRRGDRLLVGVSGGGDSAALLHCLSCLRAELGLELHAHGVDHGLRPEAPEELAIARRLAQRLGIGFTSSRVRVASGANLQARARAARYRSLQTAAGRFGAELIATGHHADDRAETVLMRLLRGAGPRGLAVLPPRSRGRVRPMIRARKADVLAHLERHAIDYVTDPSNQDRRFLRVRVRLELLPLLEALSPRVVEHLNALADQIEAGEPPQLLDGTGEPIVLGREQTRQLRRAQALGLGRVRVRLAGGREATVDPKTGQISVILPGSPRPQRSWRRRGAAEPPRRG